MGWISRRKMRTGKGIGGKASKEVLSAPLRKIDYTITLARSMFEQNHVMLECGHDTWSNGMYRARCLKCRKDKP